VYNFYVLKLQLFPPELFFQRLDIPQFPNLENLAPLGTDRKLRGPAPGHQLVGRRTSQQGSNVLAGKLQPAEALAALHHHGVYLAVVVLEGAADGADHGGKAVVADLFQAALAVEAQPGRADAGDALDLAAVPYFSHKGLDQVPCGLVEGVVVVVVCIVVVFFFLFLKGDNVHRRRILVVSGKGFGFGVTVDSHLGQQRRRRFRR